MAHDAIKYHVILMLCRGGGGCRAHMHQDHCTKELTSAETLPVPKASESPAAGATARRTIYSFSDKWMLSGHLPCGYCRNSNRPLCSAWQGMSSSCHDQYMLCGKMQPLTSGSTDKVFMTISAAFADAYSCEDWLHVHESCLICAAK